MTSSGGSTPRVLAVRWYRVERGRGVTDEERRELNKALEDPEFRALVGRAKALMTERIASGRASPGEVLTMAVFDRAGGPAEDGTWMLPAEVSRELRDFMLAVLLMTVDVLQQADARALDTDGEAIH